MSIITGSYNEYGYVIYQNGTPKYAAGNCPTDSQTYIGIEEGEPEFFHLQPLGDTADLLSLEEIKGYCESTLEEACEYPERYKLRGDNTAGKIRYAPKMIPLGMAYRCGTLRR